MTSAQILRLYTVWRAQVIVWAGGTSGSSGGGATANGSYVTVGPEAALPNSRVLTAGTNVTLADSGPQGDITISASGGSSTPPSVFLEDATAGPVVANLPAAATVGQMAIVQKVDSSGNSVEGKPNGTDTINGVNSNTQPITLQWDAILLVVVAVGAWAIV